jgi:excisionase family DNA binding protein
VERIYISIREAGSALGVSRSTIYRLVDCGELETVKIGRRRLIKRAVMAALVERGSIDMAANNRGFPGPT